MKKMKRLLSLTLAMCMLFCMMPVSAFAAQSGTFGVNNLTWTLNDYGILTISGNGQMDDFSQQSSMGGSTAPWYDYYEQITTVIIHDGVKSIGEYAFSGCSNLVSVAVPNSVTSIGMYAFKYCPSLESVTLPSNLNYIGQYAFSDCYKLTNVDLPNTLTSIQTGTFQYCEAFTNIIIPNSVTSIGYDAFSGCTSLTDIAIPSSVTLINDRAFTRCNLLANVYFGGTQEQWNKISIGTNNEKLTTANIHYAEVQGYTSGLTTTSTSPRVNDTVTINVAVNHSSDDYFNAAEMTFTYDSDKLTFNKSASTLGTATVEVNNGTVTLADYGEDKNFGTGVYVLAFDATAEGDATVTMTKAAFINEEGAVSSNLIPATINPASVGLTIGKEQFDVTLPEDPNISGGNSSVVEDGSDYTFSVTDTNYNYVFTATMGGVTVPVTDNGDGTFTIKNVTGELVINLDSKTPKTFNITIAGNASADITDAEATATYMTDYSFTMPTVTGWAYSLGGITINGVAYTGYTVADSVYTIPGTAITGDIVITVNKEQVTTTVTVTGSGAGAAAGFTPSVNIGENYILTIVPEAGYEYTVTATMGGNPVEVVVNGNTYTVKNVTGELVFIIEKSVITSGVTMSKYVTLDGRVMWLVKNSTTVAEGKVPTSDGDKMFWSEKYNAYCYLIVSNEYLTLEEVKNSIGIVEGTADEVDYSMDVNCTGKVDASDAQLTYDIYNAMYSNFTTVSMKKFLSADVNVDGKVNVADATAIINHILVK